MIKDPIVLPDGCEKSYYYALAYCKKSGERFLELRNDNGKGLALYYFGEDIVNDLDYIFICTGSSFYVHEMSMVSSAVFLDFVRENHPEHFEWLLFHPEWLGA